MFEKIPCQFCGKSYTKQGIKSHEKACQKPAEISKCYATLTDAENQDKPQTTHADTFSVHHPCDFENLRGADTIEVKNWFLNHVGEPITPKGLATACHISPSSSNKICQRFHLKGWIDKTYQNHYQYSRKLTAEEVLNNEYWKDLRVHNILISIPYKQPDTSRATLVSRTYKKYTYTLRGSRITIQEYAYKTVIDVGCTNNPLDYGAWNFLEGHLYTKGLDIHEGHFIKKLDINNDLPFVQMEGTQTVEVHKFSNEWSRVYNKKGGLRDETNLRNVSVSGSEILAVLLGRSTFGANEVLESREQQAEREKLLITTIKELQHDIKVMRMRETQRELKRQDLDKQIEVDLKEKYGLKRANEL